MIEQNLHNAFNFAETTKVHAKIWYDRSWRVREVPTTVSLSKITDFAALRKFKL